MMYRKTVCGYHADYGTHDMHWDNFGNYLGQWQDNMLDNDPPRIFLTSLKTTPILTRWQMLYADLLTFFIGK